MCYFSLTRAKRWRQDNCVISKTAALLACFRPAPSITSDSQMEQQTGDALGEKRLIRVVQSNKRAACCQFWFCAGVVQNLDVVTFDNCNAMPDQCVAL